jgi:hypothetical protein
LSSRIGDFISTADECPSAGGSIDSTIKSETSDPAPYQKAVEVSATPVAAKYDFVVTLVVKLISTDGKTDHVVKLFIDLIGAGTPTQTDKDEVCVVLKNVLAKTDASISEATIDCQLDEKLTAKRDTSYVASLSYPSASVKQSGSASGVVASFAAVAIAMFAFA